MSGYFPAGVSQDALDRLIEDETPDEDEAPDMECESKERWCVPARVQDESITATLGVRVGHCEWSSCQTRRKAMTHKRAERLTGYEVQRTSNDRGTISYCAFDGEELVAEGTHVVDSIALELLVREVYKLHCLEALEQYQWRCARCRNARQLQIHHRKYRSHGGSHRIENLEPVCSGCHKIIHKLERSQ